MKGRPIALKRSFENIIQKVKFPLIQTDNDHNPQLWKNLPKNIKNKEDRIKFMNLTK